MTHHDQFRDQALLIGLLLNPIPGSVPPPSPLTKVDQVLHRDLTMILAEYQALREEILKRVELRYQLLNILMTAAAGFLAFGSQEQIPSTVLLVYPLMALFLTAGWVHNGHTIEHIAGYLREQMEQVVPGLHWETYVEQRIHRKSPFRQLGTVATSGLVLTTQLLAIGLALLKFTWTEIEVVLWVASVLAFILTFILFGFTLRFQRGGG